MESELNLLRSKSPTASSVPESKPTTTAPQGSVRDALLNDPNFPKLSLPHDVRVGCTYVPLCEQLGLSRIKFEKF